MTNEELAHFERRLLKERERITKRLAQETDSMERDHIDEALGRLYKTPEQYGLCGECGSDIGYARLDALPQARLCIRCKESEEGTASPSTASS